MTIDRNGTIVVLDDPISSFDSNFYYHAVSYIRCSLEGIGQVFVLTHKFSFYKDLCKMCDKSTNRYVIERDSASVRFTKETPFLSEYYDEYIYLFNRIITYVSTMTPDPEESLTMANLTRKLLESYLTFKVPTQLDNLAKIKLLSGGLTSSYRAITRLVNTRSHLRIIRDEESGDDLSIVKEMPQTALELLSFICKTDPLHFETLLANCNIKLENISHNGVLDFSNPHPVTKYPIKLYDWPASAGASSLSDDNVSYSEYFSEVQCDCAVRISGQSMEPKINDGDVTLIEICETVSPGSMGIFFLNGVILCKRLIEVNGKTVLKSDNSDKSLYADILIGTDDTLKVFGKVIKVIKSADA